MVVWIAQPIGRPSTSFEGKSIRTKGCGVGAHIDTVISSSKVLVADFDQGVIGSSLLQAVSMTRQQEHQPTYELLFANETSVEDLRDKVWRGEVWGAVWASAGQSQVGRATVTCFYCQI
jgi:hypothetical protein